MATLEKHKVVSQQEWIEARQKLLQREKELTRLKDQITRERQDLPWVKVEKDYVFEGPNGKESLSDLFEGRSQLIVYHFMYGPGWKEGCDGCSFLADHMDGANLHLPHNDVTLVVVSRAPYGEFLPYKKRMGWKFKWVSSNGSDFNFDYHASYRKEDLEAGPVFHNFVVQKLNFEEQPGTSVFYKDENGEIFHTYSSYERGGDILIGTYNYLELVPKGRNEGDGMQDWMKRHDEYGSAD